MAITGSQPSYMYALGGYARGGATRGGDTDPQTYVAIGGIHYGAARAVDAQKVIDGTLSIIETEGETPNTGSFQVQGFQPTDGQDVVMTQGSKNNLDRLFAGTILTDVHGYVGTPANYNERIHVIDYTWLLTRDTLSQRWQSTSATVIAKAIIALAAGRGITSTYVAAGLPVLDEFTVENMTPAEALSALCDRIGATWKITYRSPVLGARADVRLGITTDTTLTDPTTLTLASAALTRMENFSVTRDLSQVITRQPVEGGGSSAFLPAAVGATTLAVVSAARFNVAGGIVVSGPQRLAYTGIGVGYTPNLENWLQVGGLTATLTTVIWVATWGLFVGLSNGAAYTSPDGITWTGFAVTAGNWSNLVWAPSLGILLAPNNSRGSVFVSSNGSVWTEHTLPEANLWDAAAWSPSLALFVVVAQSGVHRVATSPDGTTWTLQTAASASGWTSVVWADTLGLFVAQFFSGGGGNTIMTSPNGTAWTARAGPVSGNALAWSPTLGLLVSAGTGRVYTSPDGITWTLRTAPSGNTWTAVIWAAELGLFVMVSTDATGSAQQVGTSSDGIIWTGHTSQTGTWSALTWAPGANLVIAVGGAALKEMSSAVPSYATLTGIPASGVGSILYPILPGDPVNLRVVVDDLAAQAVLAALMLPTVDDGIIEGRVMQDDSISETEARARGTAQLALRSAIDVGITYDTRDKNTHASRTIGSNLPAPTSVVGSFKLQSVTIDSFEPALWPKHHAHGANKRFTLEDLLRVARGA